MEKQLETDIPPQEEGGKSNTVERVTLETREEAVQHFSLVKERLLHVYTWEELCDGITAEFRLLDASGNMVERAAEEGDYFRIKIPAPGSVAGDGYDYVRIRNIRHEQQESSDMDRLSITVQPAANPNNADNTAAHFFEEGASSTFLVMREANIISAEVHGRNELPNLKAENLIDKVRNAVIAIGAILGLSSTQWKKLAKGLVGHPDQTTC